MASSLLECRNGLSHSGTAIYAIFECQSGTSHSGTQVMHLHGGARMARAIQVRPVALLAFRMARAILALPTIFECHMA